MAASTTPTRMDSRMRRKATASGEPPRKRVSPSGAAGNSLVSFGIEVSRTVMGSVYYGDRKMGNSSARTRCYQNFILVVILQHLFERFQPVGFAGRLVPAQPADARKAHRDAR